MNELGFNFDYTYYKEIDSRGDRLKEVGQDCIVTCNF